MTPDGRTPPGVTRSAFDRLIAWSGSVSDWNLFCFTLLWVICGGLFLQLVLLPYVIPAQHAGNGLIAGGDWVGFHRVALWQAAAIEHQGWHIWQLRPDGQFPAGLASALYVLVYPMPWVVLPVNGVLYGTAVVAARRAFSASVGSAGAALLALAPFFLFLSFVPIWGQMHKDVSTGAGVVLVLCALELARSERGPRYSLWTLSALVLAGMGLTWLARPYAQAITGGAAIAFLAAALLNPRSQRLRVSFLVMLTVLLAWMSLVQRVTVRPIGHAPARPPVCLPMPRGSAVDRLLFSMCLEREGFKFSYPEAGSKVDIQVELRSFGDFVVYAPRAMQLAIVEPVPTLWSTSRTHMGRLAKYLVPIEMTFAYVCFLLLLTLAPRRLMQSEAWAVIAYCVAYAAIYAYSVPNLGALYRMRAFVFATLVGTALALILAKPKVAA